MAQTEFRIENSEFRMKKYFLLFLILILTLTSYVFAESNYVLPYPSAMPGSKFYQISLVWGELKKYWYFGNFGQFKYNLKESDKYLVEAKTLLEYRQYLLGHKALKKSDSYFIQTLPYLLNAQSENKNIDQNRFILRQAALKHIEALEKLKLIIPRTFIWQPEKSLPTTLNLESLIKESVAIRNKYL